MQVGFDVPIEDRESFGREIVGLSLAMYTNFGILYGAATFQGKPGSGRKFLFGGLYAERAVAEERLFNAAVVRLFRRSR